MNVSLQKILYQLLILAVPLLVSGQTSILLETIEGLPVEYSFTSSPMPPGTSIAPTHGTHTLVASGALNTYLLTYTPNDGFIGQDFIRVTRWTCSIVSQCFQYLDIYITVVPAQVRAYQDNVVTNVNTPVTINVLSNDYSSRGILIINSVSSVNNGSASFTPGGANIVFTPKPDFEGVAFLNYIVCDDENNCDNGNVSIHVRGISPPATDTVHIFTQKNTPQVVLVPPGFQRISGPSSGTYNDAGVALPEYRPNNNFTGLDYITYSDGTRQVIAQIRVLNTNFNQFAKDDVAYTTPGVAVEFNVLENDAFGTSAIMFSIVQQPANGTLVVGPENGLVVYIPNSGFSGTDKFKYSSRRPFGAGNLETATATVYVSNFEPSSATYYMNTPKVTPLVIGNNVPVPNFQFFVTDEPDFGEVLILPGEVDTVIYGRHIKGYNMVLYVPNSDVSDELDEFELVYCVTADASGAGCSFTRTVKVEIEILDIGTGAEPMCFGDCVWTGDTNFDGVVNMEDLLPIGWYMGEAGIPRADNNPALWYGKYGNNWDNPFADFYVDLKHLDADGNGYVSAHDTVAIHNFYGRTHSIVATKAPQSEYTINLTGNLFAGPGDVVELNMILGTTNQPVLNVYGLTFPFAYYPGLFVPESVQVNFSHNGWLAYNSPILFMNRNNMEGLLETGFTRTTGVSASGHGVIGTVRLIIEDDLAGIRLGDEILSVEVGGGTSTMMNAAGQTFGIEIGKANIRIRYHNEEEPVTADDLKIWPNPVGDYLNVHLNGGKDFSRIVVYNLMGQVVFNSGTMQARNAQIGVSHLPNGIYVLSVYTPDGPVTKKVEVIKK